MEPLLPASGRGELAELSVQIFQKSGELTASLRSAVVRQEVAKLVLEMNSYYSNLIEGHKTLPKDIEKALRGDFSHENENQQNQRLSVAHIRAEKSMRQRLAEAPETDVFSPEFICWLHQEFYSSIPKTEWLATSRSGDRYPLNPGKFRDYGVDVGRHTPPDHSALGAFMEKFQSVYSNGKILATNKLIVLAAAHHRLAWIHPFGDGNGRVARLQSQAAMIQMNLGGDGLWTLSRGLAREKANYYRHLQNADQGRANDYDGKGNLSDKALSDFCIFFLKQILDQITFMTELIDLPNLQKRIEYYFHVQRVDLEPKLRDQLLKLVKALSDEGEIPRGSVPEILGLKDTASREVINKALDEELVASSSVKGPLRIALPEKVMEFYFPKLFTNLPVD